MSAVFQARYYGRCAECREAIEPGDDVHYVDDALQHFACPTTTDATQLRPREVVCELCFIVKPCECEIA